MEDKTRGRQVKKISENLILRTACAFAIAFAIAGAAYRFTAVFMRHEPCQAYIVLTVGTIFYAVMGGGALLSIRVKLQPDQRGLSSFLQASIVCGVAFLIPTIIIHWYSSAYGFFTFQAVGIAHTLRFAFMGACIGGLLGSYEKNWQLIIWLAVVGAIGFSIQGIMTQSPDTVMNQWGFLAIKFDFAVMYLVSFAIRGAIAGMVGGALMGWVLRNHRENQSRAQEMSEV